MRNKTPAEVRMEQMTGANAKRRADDAAETERLIALDRQNESDELFIPKKKESEPFTGETQRLRDMATRKKPNNVRVRRKNTRRDIKPHRGGRKKDEEEK